MGSNPTLSVLNSSRKAFDRRGADEWWSVTAEGASVSDQERCRISVEGSSDPWMKPSEANRLGGTAILVDPNEKITFSVV